MSEETEELSADVAVAIFFLHEQQRQRPDLDGPFATAFGQIAEMLETLDRANARQAKRIAFLEKPGSR